jgi:hypothetical protein
MCFSTLGHRRKTFNYGIGRKRTTYTFKKKEVEKIYIRPK